MRIRLRSTLVMMLRAMDGFEDELEFLIITHPHLDHMNGLWQVVAEFGQGIKLLGWWGGPDRTLQTAYFYRMADEGHHEAVDLAGHAQQVFSLLTEIGRVRDRVGQRPEVETNVGVNQIYPRGSAGEGSPLKIDAFSPCLGEASKFTEMVTGCVRPGRPAAVEHGWQDVNRTSLGLYLTWHGVRMILGGDVEWENWDAALREMPKNKYPPVHLFKVAHHGSPNGMTRRMWLPDKRWVLQEPQPTIAVVTPFYGCPSPRPAPDVLRQMREAGCKVVVAEPSAQGSSRGRSRRVPGRVTIRLNRSAEAAEMDVGG